MVKTMKFYILVILTVFVFGTIAEKAVVQPNIGAPVQGNVQPKSGNAPSPPASAPTNQFWTDVNGTRWDLNQLHLVDAKRIVDQVSTNIPRIFTWRHWNHWLDGNKNNLKTGFESVISGEGMAFADKSFVLSFRTAFDASEINKELVTSSWTSPTGKCPPSQDCKHRGLLIIDAEGRPVAALFWQAANKQFVRAYKESKWTGVETAQWDRWYRFVQKSQDQTAPKFTLPKPPMAPAPRQG